MRPVLPAALCEVKPRLTAADGRCSLFPDLRYSEADMGRIFIIRLEDGDRLPEAIENLAREKKVSHGLCLFLGGVDGGSRLVVGPADGSVMPPDKYPARDEPV